MSVAYYIVCREEADDLDVFVNGKAVAHLEDAVIEKLCQSAAVPSLLDFISQSPEELEDFLDGEGMDAEENHNFPDEAWFTAAQGLLTVRGLLNYLRANPGTLDNSADIIEDLLEYETVLTQLEARQIAWHLALDF